MLLKSMAQVELFTGGSFAGISQTEARAKAV
jgi:hypothetical protein